jgi:2-hydroxychromene-2-carboxylate isomerase
VSAITVRDYTDPGSPHAFAAEPRRLRLLWRYGEQIAWEPRMAALQLEKAAWRPEDADELRRVQRESGMPIDCRDRLWRAATIHACRAVVAARLRWPGREGALLRRLRVLAMAGELLDDSDTLEIAAAQAGLPVAELAAYCAEPEVERALRAEVADARGRACPSWEIRRGAAVLRELPAELEARPDPESVERVLAWAGIPLATAEVAAVCGRAVSGVRAELARVARFKPAGAGGYWSVQPLT